MNRQRFAIIPSNGRDCLRKSYEAIKPQVDHVIIVWAYQKHDGAQLVWISQDPTTTIHMVGHCSEVNISAWWNRGLDVATYIVYKGMARAEWDVAIINDDVIVPEGWFNAVATAMREHGGAAACSGSMVGTKVLTEPGPVPGMANPMQGFAFMVAGEKDVRANEDLHWYFSDNYMDWESRKRGGTVLLSGWGVQHLHPNGQISPEIAARIPVDAQNFNDLYGMRPW